MEYWIKALKGVVNFADEEFMPMKATEARRAGFIIIDHMCAEPNVRHTHHESRNMANYLHLNAYDLSTIIHAVFELSGRNARRMESRLRRAFYGNSVDAEKNAVRCAFPTVSAPGETAYWRSRAFAADPARWAGLHAAPRQ